MLVLLGQRCKVHHTEESRLIQYGNVKTFAIALQFFFFTHTDDVRASSKDTAIEASHVPSTDQDYHDSLSLAVQPVPAAHEMNAGTLGVFDTLFARAAVLKNLEHGGRQCFRTRET